MRRFFAARSTASVMLLAVLFILAPFQPPVGVVGFVGSGGGVAEAAEPWDGSVATSFSGSGTNAEPFLISTAAELALLAHNVSNDVGRSADYRLTADIDLGNELWMPIGLVYANAFIGTFDGGGYTISNMLVSGDYMYAGLFGYAYGASVDIRDTHLVDFTVRIDSTNLAYAGGLVGQNLGTISNCSASGIVTATTSNQSALASAGGIAGSHYNGTITHCSASGNATADSTSASAYAGGLAGFSNNGTITHCSSSGIASAYSTGSLALAGGFVGNNNGTITNCSASGSASAYSTSSSAYAGGLAGYNSEGTISNCSPSGDATADSTSSSAYAGGLTGRNSGGQISHSSASGGVAAYSTSSTAYAGGLAGYNNANYVDNGEITNCFSSGVASATGSIVYQGGLVGRNNAAITDCRWLDENSGLQTVGNGTAADSFTKSVDLNGLHALPNETSWDIAAGWRLTSLDNDGGMHRTLFFTDDVQNVLSQNAVFTTPGSLALSGGEIKMLHLIPVYFHAERNSMEFEYDHQGVSITQHATSPDIVILSAERGIVSADGEVTITFAISGDNSNTKQTKSFQLRTFGSPDEPVDIDELFPKPTSSSTAVITPISTDTPDTVGTAITQVMPVSASISPLAASAANIPGRISLTDGLKIDIDLDAADGDVLFLNYEARLSMLAATLPELANWPNIDDEARVELLESLADSRGLALIYEYVAPENASVPYTAIIGKGGLLEWNEAITNGAVGMTSTGISFKYAITDGPGKPRLDEASKFVVIPDGQTDNHLRDPLWLAIETSDDPDDPHHGGGGVGCTTGAGMIALLALGVVMHRRGEHCSPTSTKRKG